MLNTLIIGGKQLLLNENEKFDFTKEGQAYILFSLCKLLYKIGFKKAEEAIGKKKINK